jgi:uncharacterized integral membrane protein
MKALKIFFALVILVVLFVFSVNNVQPVKIIFFGYQTPALPLFLVIVFIFSLGFLLSALLCAFKVSKLRRQVSQLQKETGDLRKEPEIN